MGSEIERKFLLKNHSWREKCLQLPKEMIQGYFPKVPGGPTVRVRIADTAAFLTIKGRSRGNEGVERSEFEYRLPVPDAAAMLEEFCGTRVVKKLRYFLPADNGLRWEIDEYLEENQGLFTAEIELPAPDTPFERPLWLGEEVSGDSRYGNGALSVKPYSRWEDQK